MVHGRVRHPWSSCVGTVIILGICGDSRTNSLALPYHWILAALPVRVLLFCLLVGITVGPSPVAITTIVLAVVTKVTVLDTLREDIVLKTNYCSLILGLCAW